MKRIEPEPVVRFETPPGKQMQADFTHVRRGRVTLPRLHVQQVKQPEGCVPW